MHNSSLPQNDLVFFSADLWGLHKDGLYFIKGKHSVDMSCNNVCLSNFTHINLFYIFIVWKCNNGDNFGSLSYNQIKHNFIWANNDI